MESEALQMESIRSRISELSDFLADSGENAVNSSSGSQKLLQDCVLALETKANQIVSEHAGVGFFKDEDLDAFTSRLSDELGVMEVESASVCKEIEHLRELYMKGICKLEHNLECLRHTVDSVELKGLKQAKARGCLGNFGQGEDNPKLQGEHHFEIMDLKHKIEKNRVTLKSLLDLDVNLKRFEAIEKIEEALTGLKVIDFEDNCIRVSLKTYIPYLEELMCQQFADNIDKQSEVKHELLIEVMNGTLELKNAEVFPNDVYIGEIVEAANNFSKLLSMLSVPQTRSSLGWFLQKVQERVVICTIRQLMVENANGSRHSSEYLDKDELIVAHMTGGIDAFIKPSQGWPLSTSALKLVSLKCFDQNAKEVSLSLLCKVEEVANSLDFNIRKNITKFVDGIEEILLEKMRAELHSNNIL